MKLIVWVIREIFKDAESVLSGQSHVASQPALLPPFRDPGGMLSRPLRMPSRNDRPPSIWDTHGLSGNVFANPVAFLSAPYPQELNPWSSGRAEPIHSFTVEKSDKKTPVQDLRCQSGPTAKDSVIFSGGDSSKNYAADQQRLQISDLHFDKFPTPATFACCKTRFKTEVCTCSQFPTEPMHWMKEVKMVDSVDDLRSSSSIRSIPMPDFEVLDAKIASALNKIIHNSHFKRKISLEEQKAQKEDRFFRGRQTRSTSTSGSLAPVILSSIMQTYLQLFFKVMIFRNSIRNGTKFYYQWRKSHLRKSWKDCTNQACKSLRNSRPHWSCTIWRFIRRKQDLIITVWRQWWKEVSSRIYESRILKPETEIMKQAPWSRIKG